MDYTITQFHRDFPDDSACLDYLFAKRYGKAYKCPSCKKAGNFSRVKARKCYACAWCGHQLHPTAGTIFHKSETKLSLWFFAIFLMSQSRNGVAGKELQRHLGVGYKTAYRIGQQIRKLMAQDVPLLSGTVEADETYVGGRKRGGKPGRGSENKTAVVGVVQRQGSVIAKAVPTVDSSVVMPLIRENVRLGTKLMTDEFASYRTAKRMGYRHGTVNHGRKEYVRGDVHTNTIEGFWSQLKRSIDGTHHAVSPRKLQAYVDEFSYRYNRRSAPIFPGLLGQASRTFRAG